MPIICFKAGEGSEPYLKDFNQRLTGLSYKTIFLKGEMYDLKEGKYAIDMKPLMFPFYYLGALGLAGTLILNSFTWSNWHIIPIIMMLSYVLFDSRSMYMVFALGLRKKGYKGELHYLKSDDVLEELLKNGTKRYIGVPESKEN